MPRHRFKLHAERFEFGAGELFDGRGGPPSHAEQNNMFAVSSLRVGKAEANQATWGLSKLIGLPFVCPPHNLRSPTIDAHKIPESPGRPTMEVTILCLFLSAVVRESTPGARRTVAI